MFNNPKLDVVSINNYANFDQNPFIRSQDIERKRNSDVTEWMLLCNELTKNERLTFPS